MNEIKSSDELIVHDQDHAEMTLGYKFDVNMMEHVWMSFECTICTVVELFKKRDIHERIWVKLEHLTFCIQI